MGTKEFVTMILEYAVFWVQFFQAHWFLQWFLRSQHVLRSDRKKYDSEFLKWLGSGIRGFKMR